MVVEIQTYTNQQQSFRLENVESFFSIYLVFLQLVNSDKLTQEN